MVINPTPEQERKIQDALRSGLIESVEELLDVGLESLQDRQAQRVQEGSVAEVAGRLASFGKRHGLSLRGLKVKDLINEGRR